MVVLIRGNIAPFRSGVQVVALDQGNIDDVSMGKRLLWIRDASKEEML